MFCTNYVKLFIYLQVRRQILRDDTVHQIVETISGINRVSIYFI